MNDLQATSTIADSTPGTPGIETRTALLAAGRHIFARNGFDGTSVRQLTAHAGVNLGAVTYHFGSKRGLYEAVLQADLGPLLDRVRRAAGADGSALDRLIRVVEAYFEHLATHPELPYLLLQEVAAGRPPPDVVLEIIQAVKNTIAALHQAGVRDGSTRAGHPALMALSVASQPVYLTLVAPLLRSVVGLDLSDEADRDLVIRHVSQFVRRGLEPRTEALT